MQPTTDASAQPAPHGAETPTWPQPQAYHRGSMDGQPVNLPPPPATTSTAAGADAAGSTSAAAATTKPRVFHPYPSPSSTSSPRAAGTEGTPFRPAPAFTSPVSPAPHMQGWHHGHLHFHHHVLHHHHHAMQGPQLHHQLHHLHHVLHAHPYPQGLPGPYFPPPPAVRQSTLTPGEQQHPTPPLPIGSATPDYVAQTADRSPATNPRAATAPAPTGLGAVHQHHQQQQHHHHQPSPAGIATAFETSVLSSAGPTHPFPPPSATSLHSFDHRTPDESGSSTFAPPVYPVAAAAPLSAETSQLQPTTSSHAKAPLSSAAAAGGGGGGGAPALSAVGTGLSTQPSIGTENNTASVSLSASYSTVSPQLLPFPTPPQAGTTATAPAPPSGSTTPPLDPAADTTAGIAGGEETTSRPVTPLIPDHSPVRPRALAPQSTSSASKEATHHQPSGSATPSPLKRPTLAMEGHDDDEDEGTALWGVWELWCDLPSANTTTHPPQPRTPGGVSPPQPSITVGGPTQRPTPPGFHGSGASSSSQQRGPGSTIPSHGSPRSFHPGTSPQHHAALSPAQQQPRRGTPTTTATPSSLGNSPPQPVASFAAVPPGAAAAAAVLGTRSGTGASWLDTVKSIGVFDTVEGFWRLDRCLKDPSGLEPGTNLYLFRHNIPPMWEHEANRRGGRWTATFGSATLEDRQAADDAWRQLRLAAIGEDFPDSDDDAAICGVTCARRRNFTRISVWTRYARREAEQMAIGRYILEEVLSKRITSDDPSLSHPAVVPSRCVAQSLQYIEHTAVLDVAQPTSATGPRGITAAGTTRSPPAFDGTWSAARSRSISPTNAPPLHPHKLPPPAPANSTVSATWPVPKPSGSHRVGPSTPTQGRPSTTRSKSNASVSPPSDSVLEWSPGPFTGVTGHPAGGGGGASAAGAAGLTSRTGSGARRSEGSTDGVAAGGWDSVAFPTPDRAFPTAAEFLVGSSARGVWGAGADRVAPGGSGVYSPVLPGSAFLAPSSEGSHRGPPGEATSRSPRRSPSPSDVPPPLPPASSSLAKSAARSGTAFSVGAPFGVASPGGSTGHHPRPQGSATLSGAPSVLYVLL